MSGGKLAVLRLPDGRFAVVRGRDVISVHGTLSSATREMRARVIASRQDALDRDTPGAA